MIFYSILEIISNVVFIALHVINPSVFPSALSKQKENELLNLALKGDKKAKNQLVECNLRLVAHIIKKFHSKTDGSEDLISVGTIGLIKAVNTFKSDKGTRLSSYAARCIENEILMHLRNVKKTSLDVSITEPIETSKAGNPLTLQDTLTDGISIFDEISNKISIEKLNKIILLNLAPREKIIIKLRYGLENFKPLTQQEIADKLGISRSYISRIEKKVIEKLRSKFINS
ncbi:MAG: RNA polymerase sporulation sigma factor SigK [Oscillospiraceae bacterium]|nr:RNA polymerase sporulation sigma factor SigK [Oscillospiraceae bacterium]